MLICFHATIEAKSALDALLVTGHFRDISEAISMALVNYSTMNQAVSEAGQVFSAAAPAPVAIEPAGPPSPVPQSQITRAPGSTASAPEIPEAFSLRVSSVDGLNLLQPSPPPVAEKTSLPPAQWLFGQFNKFLAPKATCRALLNLLLEHPSGIPVAEASNKISYAACQLGDYLRRLDARLESRREDAFSAAFPSSAIEGGGESRLRFGNQFVANIRQNQLGGFPAALRLVGIDTAKEPRLSLTKAGADFALLENPILDGHDTLAPRKLSQAEVEFLLDHIIHSVPEEISAYVAVLDAIQSGANTPDTVDKYLRHRFNLLTEKAIAKTFLTTQRTGAISRLADLGLLGRQKEGLRVKYLVTAAGSQFRAKLNS